MILHQKRKWIPYIFDIFRKIYMKNYAGINRTTNLHEFKYKKLLTKNIRGGGRIKTEDSI